MSAIRHLTRAVAISGAALIVVGAIAGPAYAADADGSLDRLPARMTAGGSAVPLVGEVRNTTRERIDVSIAIVIKMRDLLPEHVSVDGLQITGDDDEVRAVESLGSVDPRQQKVFGHQLRFNAGAPAGRANVSLEVYVNDNGEAKKVDTTRAYTVSVVAGSAVPTPTLEATTAAAPTDTAVSAGAQNPAGSVSEDGDAALWPLYVLGLLLVACGIVLVTALLLRRRQVDAAPSTVYPAGPMPGYGQAGGYPGAVGGYPGTPDAPTMIMPAVTDGPEPPPGRHGQP